MSLLLAIAMAGAAGGADANSVIGRWRAESRNAVIEIGRCGPSICGSIADSDGLRANPDMRDVKNKDTSLRTRKLLGLRMLQGFQWSGTAWEGGTVYNADDGGTYKGTITPVDADHLRLKGCIIWPLCKTQTWVRIR